MFQQPTQSQPWALGWACTGTSQRPRLSSGPGEPAASVSWTLSPSKPEWMHPKCLMGTASELNTELNITVSRWYIFLNDWGPHSETSSIRIALLLCSLQDQPHNDQEKCLKRKDHTYRTKYFREKLKYNTGMPIFLIIYRIKFTSGIWKLKFKVIQFLSWICLIIFWTWKFLALINSSSNDFHSLTASTDSRVQLIWSWVPTLRWITLQDPL